MDKWVGYPLNEPKTVTTWNPSISRGILGSFTYVWIILLWLIYLTIH
ncbi:Uncharacterised protein [Vibrio cholerae]|nr:Uncharacterised protein [Vibrio cholerae]